MNERQALGQFFTPRTVIAFIYAMLALMDPELARPRIVDPACGDGGFLSCALENRLTDRTRLIGMDVDPRVCEEWEANGLSGLPGLHVHDGLHSDDGPPVLRRRNHDWVVGNPPFGGEGLSQRLCGVEYPHLVRALKQDFTIWKHDLPLDESPALTPAETRRLRSFPIEVLFLERFIHLAKPGGRVAIILPDGVLANARLQFARDWLLKHAQVEAVVSLPRETFRGTGTAAKTSILFATRNGPKTQPTATMLASADEIGLKDPQLNQLPYILQRFARRPDNGDG